MSQPAFRVRPDVTTTCPPKKFTPAFSRAKMDPSQQKPLSAVPPHVVNGSTPTESRDQRERDSLFASIQSSASARQPIDLTHPNGTFSKPQTHKMDLVRGKAHMVNGVEEHARDAKDEASPPTPLATSRPQSPFTQHPTIDFDGLSWPSKEHIRRCVGSS